MILSLIWGLESGQESVTGSDVMCFDNRRRFIDKLSLQVRGYLFMCES